MRIDELDSLRATALVMMLISNFVTDLNYFGIMDVNKGDQWWWLARATAFLFVSICFESFGSFWEANHRRTPLKDRAVLSVFVLMVLKVLGVILGGVLERFLLSRASLQRTFVYISSRIDFLTFFAYFANFGQTLEP